MTNADLLTAAVLDARATYAHLEQLPTVELLRLQLAHQVDEAEAITPEQIAFGGGRLALIAAVLKKRGREDERRRSGDAPSTDSDDAGTATTTR